MCGTAQSCCNDNQKQNEFNSTFDSAFSQVRHERTRYLQDYADPRDQSPVKDLNYTIYEEGFSLYNLAPKTSPNGEALYDEVHEPIQNKFEILYYPINIQRGKKKSEHLQGKKIIRENRDFEF